MSSRALCTSSWPSRIPLSLCGIAFLLLPIASAAAQTKGIAEIFSNNCASCHGKVGGGGSAPTMLDDKHRDPEAWPGKGQRSNRALFDAIKTGHDAEGMPAFGQTLKDGEIWGLVTYIREQQERARRKETPALKGDKDGIFTSQHEKFKVTEVITKGIDVPWAADFLPGAGAKVGIMLITERSGKLRLLDDGKLSEPITGTPKVFANGQGGLMDVAVHPDAAKNGWVYLGFSDPDEKGRASMTKIVRGKIENGEWTAQETIYEAPAATYLSGGLHFGNRIIFTEPVKADPAGRRHLFFCIGERGRGDHAQDLARPNGKVHRVWEDGTIPADNPFLTNETALKTIWSYGHRNPQGLVIGTDGQIWDTEHGPRGGDELNLILKGRNYGWPVVSHGINYSGAALGVPWPDLAGPAAEKLDIQMPTMIWLPSTAVCGLSVAQAGPAGEAFPKWNGDLFAGGLAGEVVDRVRIRDGKVTEREEIVRGMGRVRDVTTGPEGSIYIVLNDPDHILRLDPIK